MRTTLLITAILGSTLVLSNTVGNAASIGGPGTTVYGSAPIGHLQPRAQAASTAFAGGKGRAAEYVDMRCPAAQAG